VVDVNVIKRLEIRVRSSKLTFLIDGWMIFVVNKVVHIVRFLYSVFDVYDALRNGSRAALGVAFQYSRRGTFYMTRACKQFPVQFYTSMITEASKNLGYRFVLLGSQNNVLVRIDKGHPREFIATGLLQTTPINAKRRVAHTTSEEDERSNKFEEEKWRIDVLDHAVGHKDGELSGEGRGASIVIHKNPFDPY
jgi:hypothetical protein